MNQKGLAVLEACVAALGAGSIDCVVGARDASVQNDFYQEIRDASEGHGIPFIDRRKAADREAEYGFAIGWRWIISNCKTLIVLHDSLLPKYRGFAPLPTALINGEPEVGVTALLASEEYDRGDIIAQKSVRINYPVKIQEVIERVSACYADLVVKIGKGVVSGEPLRLRPQSEEEATYSLWRDEDDYRIDWSWDADKIQRHVDALGFPYKGASCVLDGRILRVVDVVTEPDVVVEHRTPGKVIFVRHGQPTVVCGRGLVRLLDVREETGQHTVLPLSRFRTRFG
jgi:methionyl-tRNA formyltransferase